MKNILPQNDTKKYILFVLRNSKNPVFYNTDYRGHSSLFVKNNLDLMCEEYHSSSRPKLDLAEIIRITMLV